MTAADPISMAAALFPAVVSPGNEESVRQIITAPTHHQDKTNGVDVDARRIPADHIVEDHTDSDEDERTSKSAGRHAKER